MPSPQTFESWAFLIQRGGVMKTCDLCKKEFEGVGHKTAPFHGNCCCDECNETIVKELNLFLEGKLKNRMLVVGINGPLIYVDIDDTTSVLKELQFLVDGYIELYPIHNDYFYFVVNEEGLLKNMPYNHLAKELFDIDVVGVLVLCPKEMID